MGTVLEGVRSREFAGKQRIFFGTFFGVFVPTVITMMGVFSYLHLGMLLGTVGFIKMLSILIFAGLITLLTTLSIISTASNAKVGSGGSYYLLSRCFGLEIGASIGLALYIAHTLMICLCILGFTESFSAFVPYISKQSLSLLVLAFLSVFAFVRWKCNTTK